MVSKLFITIVIFFVSVSIAIAAVLETQTPDATTRPGVVAGNVFTYSIKGYSAVIGDNGSVPEAFSQLNMTDWYRVTITSVTGPQVQFNTTWRFTNGTEIEDAGNVNVVTGDDNQVFWAIYPANLRLNDLVSPGGSDGQIVSQTETRTYKSGNRDTNIMTLQNEFGDTSDPAMRTFDDYLYVHFDGATGMLVELKDMRVYSDPQVILTTQWELVDSNVWAVA